MRARMLNHMLLASAVYATMLPITRILPKHGPHCRTRTAVAVTLPAVMLHTLSETYSSVAERITGVALSVPDRPLESMMAVLDGELDLAR